MDSHGKPQAPRDHERGSEENTGLKNNAQRALQGRVPVQ